MSGAQKVASKGRKGQAEVDMNFMVSGLKISFVPDAKFRFISSVQQGEQGGLLFRLERLRTPQVWELTVTDLAKHGPENLPKNAIYNSLKQALYSASSANSALQEGKEGNAEGLKASAPATEPSIDFEQEEEGAITLILDIPFGGFPITYCFTFLPLARDPLDIVETSLHDAQEEIQELRAEVERLNRRTTFVPFIALHSAAECAANQFIAWTLPAHENSAPELFVVAAKANSTVEVTEEGVYQVNIRISTSSTSNQEMNVLVNGVNATQMYHGNANGFWTTHSMNDLLRIPAGGKIQVQMVGNNTPTAAGVHTQMSIVKLA